MSGLFWQMFLLHCDVGTYQIINLTLANMFLLLGGIIDCMQANKFTETFKLVPYVLVLIPWYMIHLKVLIRERKERTREKFNSYSSIKNNSVIGIFRLVKRFSVVTYLI